MKLYTFYTDSHTEYLCKYFLPSLKDNFELVINKKQQLSSTGEYMDSGWIDTMYYKVDTILEAINENMADRNLFIHSDIDVQFFGQIRDEILSCAKNYDIVFQKGARSINNGFFACYASKKTLNFWLDVKNIMKEKNIHDEQASKMLLGLPTNYHDDNNNAYKKFNNKYNIRWRYLSPKKFVGGQYCVESFESQKLVNPPITTLMHHATSTIGFNNKIKQLEYVKKYLESK